MKYSIKFLKSVAIGLIAGAVVLSGVSCSSPIKDSSDPHVAKPSVQDQQDQDNKLPSPAKEVDARLVAANTGFGIEFFKKLAQSESNKNLFVSPASISIALGMTCNGAQGDTLEAMKGALKLQGMTMDQLNQANADLKTILQNPDPEVELVIANSIWARKGKEFFEDFLEINKDYYQAEVRQLDFDSPEAPKTINNWVRQSTKGKIPGIIGDRIDIDTIMFLLNAIYFKGSWTYEFDKDKTREDIFYLSDGTEKKHPFMSRRGDYLYYKGEGFQAINLPYGKNKRVGMYIFLTDQGTPLQDFVSQLSPEAWEEWMDSFQEMEGNVVLPRFKIEYEVVLNEVLKSMGMDIAFDPVNADFGKMAPISPGSNIYIGNVKHKTFVDVNEEGTEAAAVTSVEMKCESVRESFNMIVNRPFLFVIRDNETGTILFMGMVSDPME